MSESIRTPCANNESRFFSPTHVAEQEHGHMDLASPSLRSTQGTPPSAKEELEKCVLQRTRELQLEIQERKRAEKNLQQQFSRMSLLNQITGAISERRDFDHTLRTVLRELERNLLIDFSAVLLLNPESHSVTVAATRFKPQPGNPLSKLRDRDTFPIAETGLRDCLHGRPFYAKDTAGISHRLYQLLSSAGLACALAVPLMVAESPFGVLMLARTSADAFNSGECEFFRMLSDHVAIAAHNARIYQQLQTAYEELKQTQQAVVQQERLRALGEMASGIAHDINNALSPIVVYSELIMLAETNLSDNARRQLTSIKTAGEDIAHFVRRMRDFYRKREDSDEFLPLACNDLVDQVIHLTRPRWHDIPLEKGIVITMCPQLQSGIPTMSGNAAELREALTNLVLNAVDAMPSGGELKVVTRCEPSPILGTAPYAIIEVTDSGIGMDEVTRTRCLEPFFSTKGQRGTGLGLAMVYGIMERHRGRIEIDSSVGKGTTVRLIIPLPHCADAELPPTEQPTIPAPLRILYVEDEPLLRDLLQETLGMDGHVVSVAEHGKAGVDAFRAAANSAQPFDIVITDLGMPHMDGRQVANILKTEAPDVPIILLTGWGAMMKADGDHPANIDAIISKPPHVNELRETLARLDPRVPLLSRDQI